MPSYRATKDTEWFVRQSDNAHVHLTNLELQDWLGAGNTPLPTAALPQEEQDIIAAKAYAKLAALCGMTPAQIQTWVDSNVTNLAQAQDAIKTLAIAVAILARRM